jgi:hypothetical protein
MAKDQHSYLSSVFAGWWRSLNDIGDDGQRGDGADRADVARLRRVATYPGPIGPAVDVAGALTIGAFRDLHRRLRTLSDESSAWDERLVVAAVTLAHVRSDVPGRMTGALLGGPDTDRKVMAEPRFLRLLRVRTLPELMDEGRRIAALLKSGAPVGDLGASMFVWLDDANRRRLWAQAYYGLGAVAAEAQSPTETQPENGALLS